MASIHCVIMPTNLFLQKKKLMFVSMPYIAIPERTRCCLLVWGGTWRSDIHKQLSLFASHCTIDSTTHIISLFKCDYLVFIYRKRGEREREKVILLNTTSGNVSSQARPLTYCQVIMFATTVATPYGKYMRTLQLTMNCLLEFIFVVDHFLEAILFFAS